MNDWQKGGLLAGAVVLVALTFFLAGRGCAPPGPGPGPSTGIDAGPGEREIDDRLDASLVELNERLGEIEDRYEADIEAFDEAQREKYRAVRESGDLDDIAAMLNDWNKRRRDAGR